MTAKHRDACSSVHAISVQINAVTHFVSIATGVETRAVERYLLPADCFVSSTCKLTYFPQQLAIVALKLLLPHVLGRPAPIPNKVCDWLGKQ